MKLIEKVIPAANAKHSATVIFFHGSGDTGNNLIEWVKFLLGRHFSLPHVKFVYPTAPVQPYTPLGNELSNVWFDRKQITIQAKECRRSLATIYETVNEMIARETREVPENRVIVGGFSMGGCLAMHTGFHLNPNLAGVFACSAFLNEGSIVYDSLEQRKGAQLPKLKMFHGGRDSVVPLDWGKTTLNELQKRGVSGDMTELKNTLHELKKHELLELERWIQEIVPPLDADLQNKL